MTHNCIQTEQIENIWKKLNGYVNGNVKWPQLITVTVSVLGIIAMLCVWGSDKVIANDRLRASEDQRIESGVSAKLADIGADIREIKTILKMRAK